MNAGAICCLLLSVLCWGQLAGAALELRLPDGSVFQGSSLSVGRAVDVLVELLCVETSGGGQPGSWRSAMGGEPVFEGLQPFGETQELGLLRIYTLPETQSFECVSPVSADTVTVQFVLEDSLFFTEDVPAVAPSSPPPPCSVPDIPAANVTVNQGGVYYCRVETERGVFRSRAISPPPEPQFRYEPQNITANPVDGTTRAAFFCAVVPSNRLTSIQWEYTGQQFGSGAGIMMPADGILSGSQDGVTIATLLEAGTSLLVIEPANNDREGFYRCVAEFTGSVTLTSAPASLLFNDTALLGDVILLPPPAVAMTFTVGDMVIVPCVTSPGAPSFMGPVNAVGAIGMFNLMIASVTPNDAGQYNCSTQSGSAVVTFDITVLEPLEFTLPLPPEAPIVLDGSGDLTVVFECEASGTAGQPTYSWLRNGAPLLPGVNVFFLLDNRVTIFPLGADDTGIYQCVAEIDGQPSTLITTSSYLLVPSVTNITVTPASQDFEGGTSTTITCLAEGNPLPAITWQRNGQSVTADAVQAATGFRETARSTLILLTSTTKLTEMIICTANAHITNEDPIVTDTATAVVNIATTPVFTRIPQDVVVARSDIAAFTCNAQSLPAPTIAWVDSNGTTLVGNPFVIAFNAGGTVSASSLQFPANLNITGVRCEPTATQGNLQLTNRLGRLATITIADAPGAVNVSVDVVLSRSAMLSWTVAQSLLPVTYIVEFIRLDTGERDSRRPTTLQIELSPLQPNRDYSVSVTPMSRAGEGPTSTSVDVLTLEDVPDDPPTSVETTSPELGMIIVEWGPPPPEEQNGDITMYTVEYIARSSGASQRENTTSESLRLDITITPGEIYTVSVAAGTAVGLGPFSAPLLQRTISPAPVFSPVLPPVDTGPTTRTSISFTLPPLPAGGNFSHVWVVAVRLNDSIEEEILSQSPNVIFRNINNSASYSVNVAAGVPYIAAEGLASLIPAEFILGDDNVTRTFNDIPLYTNGPLLEGTRYSVFVRAFVRTVGGGVSLNKRQTAPRQYSSFSSSDFLTPVSTFVPAALSAGAIVGVVIAIVLFLVVLVGMVIILYMLWDRFSFIKEHGGPPPSRKGSMRLRDPREVVTTATTLRNYKAEAELQDLNPDDVRLPVALEGFMDYTKSMHANTDHLFSEEYEILSIKSPSLPHIQCSMPVNVAKNRYANINCYDESRVHLSLLPGIDGSDYINSNYIDGYQKKNGYIATQGPLANTTQDFWRMVWEQETSCIIMLTNIVEKSRAKCHQYWPEMGSITLGELTITLIEVQQLAYYTIRTFKMSRGNDRREIKQFHYTGWPDFGVPDHPNPVIAFIRRINNYHRPTVGPDVIHCSAGVGRSGTLISIQAMMEMMREEGRVDVFNFVLAMRRHRNYMVQTERQYIFIHDAIVEKLRVGDTEIGIQNLRRRHKELLAQDSHTGSSPMEQEYKRLKDLADVDETQFHPARLPVNVPKNRFPSILPYDKYRVRLLLYPGVVGSDYINASYVDGYQHRHQYILTQGPLSSTVNEFWRMMWEHRVSSVLMLCQLEEKGKEQCVRYWPSEKIKAHGDLLVELSQESEYASYTLREFSLTNTKINESRTLKHYQFSDWPEEQSPANAAAIIDLIGVLQKTQHMCGGGPIVLHDSSSIGRAGTFSVLSSVLEQLKVEGIVDPFFVVHSLRQQQPGIVSTFDQYRFCYKAVMEFLDSFDHYANFD